MICGAPHLQEAADLLGEVQQAVVPLVEGAGNGHGEPLADGLGVALVEELRGRAALALQVVQHRLGQQDGAGADGAVWRRRREEQGGDGDKDGVDMSMCAWPVCACVSAHVCVCVCVCVCV